MLWLPASPLAQRGPASTNKACWAVCSKRLLPWPMSRASRANSPGFGRGGCHSSKGSTKLSPSQRTPPGQRTNSQAQPSMPNNPKPSGGCAKVATAPGHCAIQPRPVSRAWAQAVAAVQMGGHSTPSMASGVSTMVTQGMAHRLAIKPTMEMCPNSSTVKGARARPISTCSRSSRHRGCHHRPGACAARGPGSVMNKMPTATKLSQNPACSKAQGSQATTTASTSNQVRGQGQAMPRLRSTVTVSSISKVRCAGMPQPLNRA